MLNIKQNKTKQSTQHLLLNTYDAMRYDILIKNDFMWYQLCIALVDAAAKRTAYGRRQLESKVPPQGITANKQTNKRNNQSIH